MPPYGTEPESNGRQRDLIVAGFALILAVSTLFLSSDSQQRISSGLQQSALRPFIGVQLRLEDARLRASQVDSMLALVDSLSSMLSTHAAVVDENRTLRGLLQLSERTRPSYLPATVLRPGTPGAESMFIVDVGALDGVSAGAPVIGSFGLVGVVREARAREAVGMDWTHPDFRASAMIADGSVFGLVENRPGRFREEDRLVLNGVPFNEDVAPGAVVVTSGLGGVFPRGIPIGRIRDLADSQGEWRKSYWLDPMVEPGSATHVLVVTEVADEDGTGVWPSDPAADSAGRAEGGAGAAAGTPRG